MKFQSKASALITRVFAFLLLFSCANVNAAFADDTTTGGGNTGALTAGNAESGTNDSNPGTAWDIRKNYFLRFPVAQEFGPYESGGTDVIKDKVSQGTATGGSPMVVHSLPGCPVYVWPIYVPFAASVVPTYRDMAIDEELFQTFGFPVSDTQFQIIQRYNDNRMLEEMFDPERIMWLTSTIAGMQSTSAANGAANMTTNQSQSAIDFTKEYLTNFTAEAGNRWQTIRDQLFIPMAVLLLLPGAVLAQVKAIVSQSSPVLGETNPFEGIIRSIIAIFLIPGTFLVINYGIDVSNSITFTIADEYTRIFGTDMYTDAQCAEARAFPINAPQSNSNAMRGSETPATTTDNSGWGPYEALNLGIRKYDPCAKIDVSNSPDEEVRDAKKIARLLTNGTNCSLTLLWNTLCAFQMAFLYYLWCMGPIAAALWVWPISRLRQALPSWIEGVIVLCFWSLFWNTCVLLLACFRGVGETGTVIVTALHYLATICVKYAFDFSNLVSQGGSGGVSQAMGGAMQGAGAGMANAAKGGGAAAGHGGHPAVGGAHTTAANSHGPALAGAANSRGASMSTSTAHGAPGAAGLALGPNHGNTAGLGVGATAGATGSANGTGSVHQPPLAAGGPQHAGAVSPNTGLPPHSGAADNAILPSGPGALAGLPNTGHGGMTANQFMASSNTTAGAAAFTQNHNSAASMPDHNGAPGMVHTPSTNVGPDGKVALDTAHMGNLNGNPMDPNSQAHHQLSQQLQALSSGDPNALHQVSANAGQPMDANSKAAYDNFHQNGQQMSAADQHAVADFAAGKGGITMGADGTLMNASTGEPIHVGQGGLPPEGLHLGGQNTGVPMEANQVFSSPLTANGANAELGSHAALGANAQEMQGLNGGPGNQSQSFDLGKMAQEHPGQSFGALSAAEVGSAQSGHGLMGLAASEGVSNPQLQMNNGQMELTGANGHELAHFNASTQQWEASGTNGSVVMGSNGQWESAATHQSMAYEGGHWSQAAAGAGMTASADLGGMNSQHIATPATAEGTLGSISAGGAMMPTEQGLGAATPVGATLSAAQEATVNSFMHPGSSASGMLEASSASSLSAASLSQPGEHMLSSASVSQPGEHVLGAMNHQVGMSEAPLSQAAQHSLSGLAQAEGLGSNVSFEHTANGYAAHAANGAVVGNYDNTSGHWTTAAGGGATMDSNGQWTNQSHNPVHLDSSTHQWSSGGGVEQQLGSMSNMPTPITDNVQQSFNSLAQSEGASSVNYHATNNGYVAESSNGTVLGSYSNSTHEWTSAQGQGAVMGSDGQWTANIGGHSSSATFDNSTQQWSQSSVVNAESASSYAAMSPSVQHGLESLAQSTTGSGQVSIEHTATGTYAEAGGHTIAQYNNETGAWTASAGASAGGVTLDQNSGQWVASGSSTPVSYDGATHNWSVTGSNDSIAYHNNSFESQGYTAQANSVSESSIYQASHGHPEALQHSSSTNYGDVTNNFAGSANTTASSEMTAAQSQQFSAQEAAQQQQLQQQMQAQEAAQHHHISAPEPGMQVAGTPGGAIDFGSVPLGGGQTVASSSDNWFTPAGNTTYDATAASAQNTYYDPNTAGYNFGTAGTPDPTVIASANVQPNLDQYPTINTASNTPDLPQFAQHTQQIAEGPSIAQVFGGYVEPNAAPAAPVDLSSYSAPTGGAEAQIHVQAPDSNAAMQIASAEAVAGAGAAVIGGLSNASYASTPAPAPAPSAPSPETHYAPPSRSDNPSPLAKALGRATGTQPAQQQSAPASSSEPAAQEAKVQEGGLGAALAAKAQAAKSKKDREEAHRRALLEAGQQPEDA